MIGSLQSPAKAEVAAQDGQAGPKAEPEAQVVRNQIAGMALEEVPKEGHAQWCQCGCCPVSGRLEEQLCCRRERGCCLSSSPLFPRLVLSRSTLETLLLYQSPLMELHEEAHLRHAAYAQFISWRFGGDLPQDAVPVVPRCCVARIRAQFPSSDGRYGGLRFSRPL